MVCHGLPRDTGSWAKIPWADRVYALCGPGSLGDEKHLVFECPLLQHIRHKYAALFHCPTMKQFFWQEDLISVAKFVSEGFNILLGADSDAQSQSQSQLRVRHQISPRWLGLNDKGSRPGPNQSPPVPTSNTTITSPEQSTVQSPVTLQIHLGPADSLCRIHASQNRTQDTRRPEQASAHCRVWAAKVAH